MKTCTDSLAILLCRLVTLVLVLSMFLVSGAAPAYAQLGALSDMFLAFDPSDANQTPIPTIAITYTPQSNYGVVTRVVRTPSGMGANPASLPNPLANYTYYDQNWTSGTQYIYQIYGWISSYNTTTMQWESHEDLFLSITVRPFKVVPSANQTVDKRYDKRYSTYVFKDFKFDTMTYRGGLYAGYNSDGSEVGRSYLKFPLNSSSGASLWNAGGLYLYYTRMPRTGSVSVVCRGIVDPALNTWDAAALVQSIAPAVLSTGSNESVTVFYDAANPANPTWVRTKSALYEVQRELGRRTGSSFDSTFVLQSTNEGNAGWAYFAKKEYALAVGKPSGLYSPILLFAYGGTGIPNP